MRPEDLHAWRRYFRIAALILLLIMGGAIGFMAIEGWSFLDAIYMAVITLTTVGFHEVHSLGTAGRIFVMFYVIIGLSVFLYGAAQIGEGLLRGQLRELLGGRRMEAAVKSLENHVIVCGYGRMGRKLCRQLSLSALPFVVVDRDKEALAAAEAEGWTTYCGDVTDDRVLQAVRVDRARGLAAVLSGDADNLYVVLSSRLLNPGLQILARATDEMSMDKMRRAGANRVINIYETGAHKMAQLLSNANLEDFIEILSTRDNPVEVAQFTVSRGAPYCGRTLADAGFRERGIMIVGLGKAGGEFLIPPPSNVIIDEGDRLIALGRGSDLTDLLTPPA